MDFLLYLAFSLATRFHLSRALQEVAKTGRLPVVNFAAGGIATPADAALMMQLGVDGEAPGVSVVFSYAAVYFFGGGVVLCAVFLFFFYVPHEFSFFVKARFSLVLTLYHSSLTFVCFSFAPHEFRVSLTIAYCCWKEELVGRCPKAGGDVM